MLDSRIYSKISLFRSWILFYAILKLYLIPLKSVFDMLTILFCYGNGMFMTCGVLFAFITVF